MSSKDLVKFLDGNSHTEKRVRALYKEHKLDDESFILLSKMILRKELTGQDVKVLVKLLRREK